MAVAIVRSADSGRRGGFTIVKATKEDPPLRKMHYDGELPPHPIQFQDDVAWLQSHLRARGIALADKDCQALWHRLSYDYYPFKSQLHDWPWLTLGMIASLVDQHSESYLIDAD